MRTTHGELFFRHGEKQLQISSDYGLRYRYLRMQGKATSSDFAHIDSIFITHRNPKTIQEMQQKVVNYEQALQRQVELLLQQERIQQEQGELKEAFDEIEFNEEERLIAFVS